MIKGMETKSGINWNDRRVWEQICENVGYSPEKIGAYVLENLLNGIGVPPVQHPNEDAAGVSGEDHTSGSLPLTMDELREMNDADVWIVFPAGADGSRRIIHALVESDRDSGNVWLTNSLGGRVIFDDLNETGAGIFRKKPQIM